MNIFLTRSSIKATKTPHATHSRKSKPRRPAEVPALPLTPLSSWAGFPQSPAPHHPFYGTNWARAGPLLLPDGAIRAQPSLPTPWRGHSHPPCRQFSGNSQVFTYLLDFNPSFELDWKRPARLSLSVGGTRGADRLSEHKSLVPLQTRLLKSTSWNVMLLELHLTMQGNP